MRLPIVAGPLRGSRWLANSGGKVLRILGGTYEPEQTALFERRLRPGFTIVDVGAHVGYYTLLASRLVGPEGQVWALEPSPRNGFYLRRHVEINRLRNVRTAALAVADANGTARFTFGTGTGTGRLDGSGEIEVPTVTLDSFCAAHAISPRVLKIDVEGAEGRVLAGASALLERDRPLIFLSTHGPELHRACLDRLAGFGYELEPILGTRLETASEVLALHRSGPGR